MSDPKSDSVSTVDEYEDFASLAQSADTIVSSDVVSDKNDLIGIPFVIVDAKFFPSDMKTDSYYASLNIRTEDGRSLILNDGSTGIRRQVVAYLCARGLIEVPEGPEGGKDSKYDAPIEKWEDGSNGSFDISFDDKARAKAVINGRVALLAQKGLRRSDYETPNGKASTFYLT